MNVRAAALLSTLLFAAAPATGQTTAHGSARLEVGEVLALRVQSGGGVAQLSADGVYREMESAIRLDITANRSWQLTVRTESGDALASLSGVGDPQRAIWYRVAETRGVATDAAAGYVGLDGGQAPVASGGPGSHILLDLDYRWLEGEGREAGPGVMLYFTLSPG